MNLKKIGIGAVLGIGAVVAAPVAVGGLAVGATFAGAYSVGAALTGAAVELAMVSAGTGAAVGAVGGMIHDVASEKVVDKAVRKATVDTAQVYEEKIHQERNKADEAMKDMKDGYEEKIKNRDKLIKEQESVISALSDET